MEILLKKSLEREEENEIKALIERVNVNDKTDYDSFLDGDFYYLLYPSKGKIGAILTGFLEGELHRGRKSLEIMAFTDPDLRGRGYFDLLFRSLMDDFRSYSIKFMLKAKCENDRCEGSRNPYLTEEAFYIVNKYSLIHEGDELFMEKSLENPIKNPGDSLCDKSGEVHFTEYSKDTLYLYGMLTYDSYLRKGYGEKRLRRLEDFEKGRYRKILLEVSSANIPAHRLYLKLRFKETERILYFRYENPFFDTGSAL